MLLRLFTNTAGRLLAADPELTSIPSVCPLQIASGHACPLCGMTRAVGSLASGDIGAALTYHPMAVVLSLQLAAIALFVALGAKAIDGRLIIGNGGGPARLLFVNASLFMAVWILRWRFDMLDAVIAT